MKTVILYESTHHGNTEKLVRAIAEAYEEVTVTDLAKESHINFGAYQCIGLASGIAYGNFYEKVTAAAGKIPAGKKVFLLYTAGSQNKDYAKKMREILKERNAKILGSFHCKGWDTYGFFGKLGGINRSHPDRGDLSAAVDFYGKMRELQG